MSFWDYNPFNKVYWHFLRMNKIKDKFRVGYVDGVLHNIVDSKYIIV